MPDLLIEFLSEEIPARMQPRAEADLERLAMDAFSAAGVMPSGLKAFAGPRRLALAAEGLPARTADVKEERKGPKVGAPDQAIQGFLRSAGLKRIEDAQIVADKKGVESYVAVIDKPGRDMTDLIAQIVPGIVKDFPWPKSMRSGVQDLRWVRPLRGLLVMFDGEPVAVSIERLTSGRTTVGHRFHAPGALEPRRFEDYESKLKAARVIVRREERKDIILSDARTVCAAQELALVEDPGLLEEVSGLVEWPVVVMGQMDPAFLDLPAEVIRLTMRTHQKYFAVRDPKTGKLAPRFITVANIEAKDGGTAIAAGNARVLSARLNDARFFWAKDREVPLYTDERREKLKGLVFHAKLGSVWDKVERVKALAVELAAVTGADPALVARAAELCKMDLVTETVGEFPELQGQIGRQLAEGAEHPSVAAAIEDHYRPLGPNDRVPTDPEAVTLALADKLDTLAGFWAIDEKPTGSSDAYGLRRAALGLVRTTLDNGLKFRVHHFAELHLERRFGQSAAQASSVASVLVHFVNDRLQVQLREKGRRHDLVDAVLGNLFAASDLTLVSIVARVEALDGFLKTEDGKNLLAGYTRAANILAAEEKKGKGVGADWSFEAKALAEPAEKALHSALEKAAPAAKAAVEKEDFTAAMAALAALRQPVDAFFTEVLVNAEDATLRRNRLLLLTRMRDALAEVADFSKIEG
jgi:glycyl-tRNA synthetase beta chain